MRKELGEGQKQENEPQDGSKSQPRNPRDPNDRRDGRPEDPETDPGTRPPNTPAWNADLPAQVRDAESRGDFERIPEQYRERVLEYIRWLQAAAARQGDR